MHQRGGLHRRGSPKDVKSALPQRCIMSMGLPSSERIGVKATSRGMQQRHEQPAMCAPACERAGRTWQDQAAGAGAAAGPTDVVGACKAGSAATAAGPRSGTRWPAWGGTSGGSQPRLNSRKSNASRQGPWVRQTGAVGMRCSNDTAHPPWRCSECIPVQVSNPWIVATAWVPNAYDGPAILATQPLTPHWQSQLGTTLGSKTGGWRRRGGRAATA